MKRIRNSTVRRSRRRSCWARCACNWRALPRGATASGQPRYRSRAARRQRRCRASPAGSKAARKATVTAESIWMPILRQYAPRPSTRNLPGQRYPGEPLRLRYWACKRRPQWPQRASPCSRAAPSRTASPALLGPDLVLRARRSREPAEQIKKRSAVLPGGNFPQRRSSAPA